MKFGLDAYTVDRFAARVFETYADRPSLAAYGQEPISYAEFSRRVTEQQERLLKVGIGHGERVAIFGTSTPEWAIAYLAVMTIGAVAIPIMEEFPPEDIRGILHRTQATGIFTTEHLWATVSPGLELQLKLVYEMQQHKVLAGTPGTPVDRQEIREDDVAEILFTSGTTGFSKGVVLSHKNLVSNLFEGPDLVGCIHDRSRTLSLLPLAHAYGSTSGFLSIIYGGSALYFLGKKPTPKLLMQALGEIQPTVLGGVPLIFEKIYARRIAPLIARKPLLRWLAAKPRRKQLLYKLIGAKVRKSFGGKIECAIIGGAPLSTEVELFLRAARIPTVLGYGMTEASPLITFSSREGVKIGSVGHPITDVEVKIHKPDPESGVGEVWVRGPNIMQGYFEDPEETAKVLTEDGWLITGDLGYLDDDGYLFLRGRSKNVIIGPSGENIYPEVIEGILNTYVEVDESLVVMRDGRIEARVYPDPETLSRLQRGGEEAEKAFAGKLDEIKKAVNSRLPGYSHVHRMVLQREEFIKTVTNKIKRAEYYGD
ncbi:AMP-binding protein [Spirochaeta africana]|uniref:AMP-forming long-chain acyl-CoA synthetase n=1 Tax=Spirochaeta africana (strain ATCC 700263 / DSM 8902 / Z-7692) TaxID=889378 RepID=H9UHM0_SPIAZ|nr:AMP-binding protein [Spirochaeta africana]AFG37013.1 AMP-forming long-chain acyl-CoA synthetase [Spirochaeta africana DSM 8902]